MTDICSISDVRYTQPINTTPININAISNENMDSEFSV